MPEAIYADTIGATIKANRVEHGMSVRHLAKQIAATPPQVLRWERGDYLPTPQHLMSLARALELRAADLFLIAGVPLPEGMPSLPAMLRAEYDLPSEAIAEIRRNIDEVVRRYTDTPLTRIETKERGIIYEE